MTESSKLGALDFFNQGMDEYTLIAVKAPFEETIQAFTNILQNRKTRQRINYATMKMEDVPVQKLGITRSENIPLQDMDDEYEEMPYLIPFVQVKGSTWTIILRSMFGAKDELYDTPEEIKAISVELATKAICLMEEDTSGALAYEIFENGDRLEYFEEACEDDFRFESKLREKPDIKMNNWDEEDEEENSYDPEAEYDSSRNPRCVFVDRLFRDLSIYLPAAYPSFTDRKPSLTILKSSFDSIQKCDCLTIEMELTVVPKIVNPDDDE